MNRLIRNPMLLSLVLLGCPSTPSGVTPKPRVLRANFEVVNHHDFTGKSTDGVSTSISSNKLTVKGSITERVLVDTLAEDLVFHAAPGDVPTIEGTVTEVTRCHSEDPDSNSIVKMDAAADLAGPIGSRLDHSVKKSKLGTGDELTLGVEAAVAGAITGTITDKNGVTQPMNSLAGCAVALHTVTSGEAPRYAERWLIFPSLGARPDNAADALMYDAITKLPKGHHVGLTTAAGRDAWHYKGTRVIADKDTATERVLWAEDVEIDWRLE